MGGRGLKSLRDVFVKARISVKSSNKWIKVAWEREWIKETNPIKNDAIAWMHSGDGNRFWTRLHITGWRKNPKDWKPTWISIKIRLKKGAEEKRKEDISKTGWKLWFMADTKSNTKKDYLSDDYAGTNNGNLQEGKWRLCGQQRGTVEHLLDGCRVLVNKEYLTWHKKAWMTLVVSWGKEFNLVEKDIKWYKQKRRRGYVLENNHVNLVCDFELNLRKSTTSGRPDLKCYTCRYRSTWCTYRRSDSWSQ